MVCLMRKKLLLLATFTAAATLLAPLARADDFVRESIPNKWITPLIPEDFDKLDYPAYFKTLDKARLESFTGRYKLSLLTLQKVKDADPAQVALIRAASQSALGQKDAAIKTLANP